jgi:hypothetical protein
MPIISHLPAGQKADVWSDQFEVWAEPDAGDGSATVYVQHVEAGLGCGEWIEREEQERAGLADLRRLVLALAKYLAARLNGEPPEPWPFAREGWPPPAGGLSETV